MAQISSCWVTRAGVRLHVATAGREAKARKPLLLLHGFPDHWIGWRAILPDLSADRLTLAPDGRGVNLSDAPEGVEAYALDELVADGLAIADAFGAGCFDVAGHDWGGVVAWALAQRAPTRVRRIAILNAPHPSVLGRALAEDPEQRQRSRYITRLRSSGAEQRLEEADYAPLLSAYAEVAALGAFGPAEAAERKAAWSRPGRLRAALNWYRAAKFLDDGGESWRPVAPLATPALLLWGERDEAFIPDLPERCRAVAPGLRIERLSDLGHWPHREAPRQVADRLRAWFGSID